MRERRDKKTRKGIFTRPFSSSILYLDIQGKNRKEKEENKLCGLRNIE